MMSPHDLAEVFLLEETRTADKTGCISLLGQSNEVASVLAGQKVQVRFDPYDLSKIQVWKNGTRYENARVLKLRDPKQQRVKEPETESPTVQPTGLNYVELLFEEHRRQIHQAQGTVLQDLVKVGKQP